MLESSQENRSQILSAFEKHTEDQVNLKMNISQSSEAANARLKEIDATDLLYHANQEPSKELHALMEIIMKLLQKSTDWQTVTAELKNTVQLIRNLSLIDHQSVSEDTISDVQAFIELEDFDPKAIDKNGGQMAQAMLDWVQILYQNYYRQQAIAEISTQMEVLDQD